MGFHRFSIFILVACAWIFVEVLTGCGYRIGKPFRKLPGGFEQVSISMFENQTQEVAVEPLFTNALVEEFETSKIARVVSEAVAPVRLKGRILSVRTVREAPVSGRANSPIPKLPQGTSLATGYRIQVQTELSLVRNSDQKILWKSFFEREVVYQGPRIGTEFVNSVNANYNASARREKMGELASIMMREAHDRVTENF